MPTNNTPWLKWASELQAIAQNGLTYSKNIFDLQRFQAILSLSAEIMAEHTNVTHEQIINLFSTESGYATP